ncbi:hypothetical protein D9M68_897260 [compost metagenome]
MVKAGWAFSIVILQTWCAGLGDTLKPIILDTSLMEVLWLVIVINTESLSAGLLEEIAFAQTVPFPLAVTTPEVLIFAAPDTGTILQFTDWIKAEGNIATSIGSVPPDVLIWAAALF